MLTYRLRIDLTYTTVNNATTATTNINNVLSQYGYIEQATRTGTQVAVVIDPVGDMDQAITLRNALTAAWGSTARSGGKVSIVKKGI